MKSYNLHKSLMHIIKQIFLKLFLIKSRTELIINQFQLDKTFKYSWGMKKSGKYFRDNRNKYKFAFLEDGFIHSFGIKKQKVPLAICFDKKGIYYNTNIKNDLTNYLQADLSIKDFKRSKNLIRLWKKYSLSKYNFSTYIEPPSTPYILLVDQTYGDLSLEFGDSDKKAFEKMFDFAAKNWPNHKLAIKVHPDVINSKKSGNFHKKLYLKKNVIILSENGQINKLIEFSTAVCVVTSQVGFEALIYGKDVHVFGRPFYSELGLTIDHKASNKKNKNINISLEKLVYSTLVKYQICLDPRTKNRCEVENIMEYINSRRKISQFFPNNLDGIFLTPWKARQINRFVFPATGKYIRYFKKYRKNMRNIIVWGKNPYLDRYIYNVKNFISVEDGFIRSVGLGGNLFPAYSLLFDRKGIHYDASRSCHLEELLKKRIVEKDELIRSKELINLINKSKISKYNLRLKKELDLPNITIKKNIIAVIGQVETDNSILYGVPNDTIQKTNYSLVERVKRDFPDSYIVYKPHPDVESGLRAKGKKESSINKISDLIAYDTSIEEIFKKVDRVAVFTSLAGFEALIRGVSVTTYGLPFYAGWGLTEDKLHNHKWAKRRNRKLTLEELIFISLIEYPLYYSLKFNCLTEIEHIIDELLYTNNNPTLEQKLFKYWGVLKERIIISRNK